jgi:hypothetical protein
MNKEKWLLALISFVISLNAETISALGDNLVMNHDFSLPNILPLGVRQKTLLILYLDGIALLIAK